MPSSGTNWRRERTALLNGRGQDHQARKTIDKFGFYKNPEVGELRKLYKVVI